LIKNKDQIEDKLKEKILKDIRICLSEIFEEENRLTESIIHLRIALNYSHTEEEKEIIEKKFDLLTSKI